MSGPLAGMNTVEEKHLHPYQEFNPSFPVIHPLA